MKSRDIILVAMSLFVLAGCASAPKTSDVAVQLGMSRSDLRLSFGVPLRIEPAASGGETWYYSFKAWKTHPVYASGTSESFGETTSYASAGLQWSEETKEEPIYVSSAGYVIDPLPDGKVVQK